MRLQGSYDLVAFHAPTFAQSHLQATRLWRKTRCLKQLRRGSLAYRS
jgi:hypothetical protein